MNTSRNGNGLPRDDEGDDLEYPQGVLAAMHRDPHGYWDFVVALNRLLSDTGEPFTPCTGPCPLCEVAVNWPNQSY
jgi:hypothetical protein